MPVTMPAPWIGSSYIPFAASGDNSRNGEPGSSRPDIRSRGSSLPRATWRSRARCGPPSAASARRVRYSPTSFSHSTAFSGGNAGSNAPAFSTAMTRLRESRVALSALGAAHSSCKHRLASALAGRQVDADIGNREVPTFETIDGIAAAFFVLCWAGYSWLVDYSPFRYRSLTAAMNAQRRAWMETMSRRENRMMDAQIINGLQSGSAFFASASLLAIGAAFALLTTSEQVLGVVGTSPSASARLARCGRSRRSACSRSTPTRSSSSAGPTGSSTMSRS